MKFRVFWDVAPCSHVEVHRRFRGAYCLILTTLTKSIFCYQVVLITQDFTTNITNINVYTQVPCKIITFKF
jgi:hypothetical protein